MKLRHAAAMMVIALADLCANAAAQSIPDSLSGRTIVTYVTGQSVYIGAGHLDGVWVGSRVMIVHGGVPVAELRVRYLSSHGASCELPSGSSAIPRCAGSSCASANFCNRPKKAGKRSPRKMLRRRQPRLLRSVVCLTQSRRPKHDRREHRTPRVRSSFAGRRFVRREASPLAAGAGSAGTRLHERAVDFRAGHGARCARPHRPATRAGRAVPAFAGVWA